MHVFCFWQGVGRRRSHNLRRQHSSHFCLCHEEADSGSILSSGDVSVYKADFTVKQAMDNVPGSGRRFPRNHRQKSAQAASAQTEQFMWFGRHDSSEQRSASSTSRPKDTLVSMLLHNSAWRDWRVLLINWWVIWGMEWSCKNTDLKPYPPIYTIPQKLLGKGQKGTWLAFC